MLFSFNYTLLSSDIMSNLNKSEKLFGMSILLSKNKYIFSKGIAPYILSKRAYFIMRMYIHINRIHICIHLYYLARTTTRAPAFSNVKIATDERHWRKRKLTNPCFEVQWCNHPSRAAGDRDFGRKIWILNSPCMWHARDTLFLSHADHTLIYLTASCRAWWACHAAFDNFLRAFGRTRFSLNNARRATRSASWNNIRMCIVRKRRWKENREGCDSVTCASRK